MAFCKNCGQEIDDEAVVCPHCGTQQKELKVESEDNAGFGWGLLSFCLPIVGLILFIIWREEKPKTAKLAGICALVGFILNIIAYASGLAGNLFG